MLHTLLLQMSNQIKSYYGFISALKPKINEYHITRKSAAFTIDP